MALGLLRSSVASAVARPAAGGPGVPTAVTALLVVGFALRVWHYAANHTIWYDEAVLLANVLNKGYAALLGPLDNAVAAPPLFLWLLKTIAVVCGDQAYCWRALPFACSCGTLALTPALARRVLSPAVVPVAVGLVALSDSHVWLGCTVKPYAGDCLLTTMLLLFFAATGDWTARRRLRTLAAVAPVALCLSYPTAFVFGGLLVALLPAARREGRRGLGAWALACLAVGATFAALYLGPVKAQRVAGLVDEWARDFPDWKYPVTVPGWAAEHTATVFQYCYLPAGLVLVALAPVGFVAAWRTGRRSLVVALAVPFALAMAAAGLRAYPYGFNRLMLFVAPCAVLLGGLGLGAVLARLNRRWGTALVAVLLLAEVGPVVQHLVRPWPKPDAASTTKYVQAHRQTGDLVASDEDGYLYFFRGELIHLEAVAPRVPPGGRVWVVKDHYGADVRREYVRARLEPAGLRRVSETVFHESTAFLYVRD